MLFNTDSELIKETNRLHRRDVCNNKFEITLLKKSDADNTSPSLQKSVIITVQDESEEKTDEANSSNTCSKKFYSKYYKYKTASNSVICSTASFVTTSNNLTENGIMDEQCNPKSSTSNNSGNIRPTTSERSSNSQENLQSIFSVSEKEDIFESFDFAKFFYNPSPTSPQSTSSNPVSPVECTSSPFNSPDYYDLQNRQTKSKSQQDFIEEKLFTKNLLLSPSSSTSDSEIENKQIWCSTIRSKDSAINENENLPTNSADVSKTSSEKQTSSEVIIVQSESSDDENKIEDKEEENVMVLLPTNPEEWTQEHIESWLKWCTRQWCLKPAPKADQFPETGASLCKLTRTEMLDICAGNERNSRLLAVHLAHLRHSATGRATSPLQENLQEVLNTDHDGDDGVDNATSN